MIDRKIPRAARRRVPLLAVASEVLWAPFATAPGAALPGAVRGLAELRALHLLGDGGWDEAAG